MIWLNTKLHEIDEALQEVLNDSVWLDCNVSRVDVGEAQDVESVRCKECGL